jgi:hypothetical protein
MEALRGGRGGTAVWVGPLACGCGAPHSALPDVRPRLARVTSPRRSLAAMGGSIRDAAEASKDRGAAAA